MALLRAGIELRHGDIDRHDLAYAVDTGVVACDIETSGLDWRKDSIGTCQIAMRDRLLVLIPSGHAPSNLRSLLENSRVQKVFHHATFDLRFMAYRWGVRPRNIACTKVAAKILEPGLDRAAYSLKPVLKRFLAVEISKDLQVSDWLAPHLSDEQLMYAANDVLYLVDLCGTLRGACEAAGLGQELTESWRYLPVRVALDMRGSGDVFSY